jgi:hypothetical protein
MRFPGVKIVFILLLGIIAFPARAQFEIPPKPPAGQQTSIYDYY